MYILHAISEKKNGRFQKYIRTSYGLGVGRIVGAPKLLRLETEPIEKHAKPVLGESRYT